MSDRIAVIAYNLGGPDSPEAVKPFLFNLFNDKFIIRQPAPLRWLIAKIISSRRTPTAQKIYAEIGGRSPILEQTEAQAKALQDVLNDNSGDEFRVFVAMRYWHPFAADVAKSVNEYAPDKIVLLPLYPQFSTSTTESFLSVWNGLPEKPAVQTRTICCYPTEPGFIAALSSGLSESLDEARKIGEPRVLFSAHGLPKKFVADGDPYQKQVEATVQAILAQPAFASLDHVICYQSRVGPVEWLKPYTDEEINRAGEDGKPIVVVPVAFVSEHSETLVELDIEYAALAENAGAPGYFRVATVQTATRFIDGLASVVEDALASEEEPWTAENRPACDGDCKDCPRGHMIGQTETAA